MNKYELKEIVWGYLEFCRTNDEGFHESSQAITAMTFLSPPELQWEMILEAVRQARDQDDLNHIVAGPIEGFLGRHGEEFIERVEGQAAIDPKFGCALKGVWKYMMSDEVWGRVQALQARIPHHRWPPG